MEYLDLRVADSWGMGRTDTYRGSTTDKQDREVLKLKKNIKMNNKVRRENAFRAIERQADYGCSEEELMKCIDNLFSWHVSRLQRVRFMGRGKRRNPDGSIVHHNCDSYLNHDYASYFDVYVHEDDESMRILKEKLKREFCPKYMEIKDLEWEIRKMQYKLESLKR